MRSSLTLDVRYRLEERIAAGGVGQVWRGTDLLLERSVAVKVLRPEYASHPETLERFRAEARHAGALSHPSIAQVYDYRGGGDRGPDGSPYLVMELVDGSSLADWLDAGTLDVARTLDIVAQVAAGLAAAHRTGLVHRDIKPANILISSDGLVKITDFGIAHAAGSAPLTAPEMVMGTAQYLAPERITGEQDGPAGDLYSLGIVMYECLVGQPPFTGTTAEVMSAHLYVPLPPLPSGIPSAVSELVALLTAKDPATRLCDAAELASAARRLSAALGAEPPQLPVEPAGIAQPVRSAGLLKNAEPAQPAGKPAKPAGKPADPTGKDARPRRKSRMPILAVAAAAAALAVAIGGVASGALRDVSTHGQAGPGHDIQRDVAPSPSAAAGSGRTARPSPSASPVKRGSPRNAGTSRATHQASGTGGTTGSSAARTGTTGSGSGSSSGTGTTGSGSGSSSGTGSGSGSGIILQVPPIPPVGITLP